MLVIIREGDKDIAIYGAQRIDACRKWVVANCVKIDVDYNGRDIYERDGNRVYMVNTKYRKGMVFPCVVGDNITRAEEVILMWEREKSTLLKRLGYIDRMISEKEAELELLRKGDK